LDLTLAYDIALILTTSTELSIVTLKPKVWKM